MPKKEVRGPNEPEFKMSDLWHEFEIDYKPFVEWMVQIDKPNESFAVIQFIEDSPVQYKNKWNREQWKIRVYQDKDEKILSGGKKLFSAIMSLCQKEQKLPRELPECTIWRKGSGFETNYSILINTKQTKI